MSDVTRILAQIEQGDPRAAEKLLPVVYDELRKLAAARLAQEKPGQTLQATALVHEAYLRLVDTDHPQNWNGQRHFFGAAAEAMRRILVENARRKQRIQHGGQLQRVDLLEVDLPFEGPNEDVLAVNEGLEQLAKRDAQTAELIKLHYFAGLTIEQAAQSLDLSPRTAYRLWAFGRAWLYCFITHTEGRSEE